MNSGRHEGVTSRDMMEKGALGALVHVVLWRQVQDLTARS